MIIFLLIVYLIAVPIFWLINCRIVMYQNNKARLNLTNSDLNFDWVMLGFLSLVLLVGVLVLLMSPPPGAPSINNRLRNFMFGIKE